jgi:hypothetical protein
MRERVTIDLELGRKHDLKQMALDERRSLGSLVREAVEDLIEKKAKDGHKKRKGARQ